MLKGRYDMQLLCTLLKLQGSQAICCPLQMGQQLCTLLKLQGSQASNCFEALTEPCHVGAWCIFYKAIYRLQAFFAIGNDTIVCIHHCINV